MHRLKVFIWADPWDADGSIVREVWMDGGIDGKPYSQDRRLPEVQVDRWLRYHRGQPRTDVRDLRPMAFPFERPYD